MNLILIFYFIESLELSTTLTNTNVGSPNARDHGANAGARAGEGAGTEEAEEENDIRVDAEAVLNCMDAGGLTPLMTAALYGNVAATEALLSATKPDSSPFVDIWLQVRSSQKEFTRAHNRVSAPH